MKNIKRDLYNSKDYIDAWDAEDSVNLYEFFDIISTFELISFYIVNNKNIKYC